MKLSTISSHLAFYKFAEFLKPEQVNEGIRTGHGDVSKQAKFERLREAIRTSHNEIELTSLITCELYILSCFITKVNYYSYFLKINIMFCLQYGFSLTLLF